MVAEGQNAESYPKDLDRPEYIRREIRKLRRLSPLKLMFVSRTAQISVGPFFLDFRELVNRRDSLSVEFRMYLGKVENH